MAKSAYRVLILGAGAGGISVAAKLSRSMDAGSIAIVDPSEFHYYQPMWTLAGAGLADKTTTEKPTRELIPSGVTWLKERVESVDPEKKIVSLSHGMKIGFDFLVVATGLK